MDKIPALFKSKRFWLATAGLLAVIFKDTLGIPEEEIQQVVMLIAAWILGDSWRPTDPGDEPAVLKVR